MTQDIDRLASAVVHRFAASQGSARLVVASKGAAPLADPSLVERLASAVGQRLAKGSSLPHLEALASAVAKRLSASAGAARLASAATRHYALNDINKVASGALNRLATPSKG